MSGGSRDGPRTGGWGGSGSALRGSRGSSLGLPLVDTQGWADCPLCLTYGGTGGDQKGF